jgi:molecular chaperone GrpE
MASQEPPLTADDTNFAGETAAQDAPGAKAGLEDLLKQAEARAEEHKDAWLRAKAETENARKRAQLDLANAYKYAVEDFAERLLPVRDSLEAALAAPNPTVETLRAGVELTLKQLDAVFEKASLAEINPVGEKFDPHQHQAISMVPRDGEPNRVVSVLQKGYRLHDRVVRPALVTVSKAPEA